MLRPCLAIPPALVVTAALAACGGDSPTGISDLFATCGAEVNLFPTPVADSTSLFPDVDDSFLLVPFASGFDFSFYGSTYDEVYLNSNGGLTFDDGVSDYDIAAADIVYPGIAIFWGDLDAGDDVIASARPNQMRYEACPDRFIIRHFLHQDNDDDTWNNTATVALEGSGKITVQYGTVLSQDILVGVFDGSHTDDRYVTVQNSYSAYSTTGTGTILFDDWGPGPTHTGQLSNRTITYNP